MRFPRPLWLQPHPVDVFAFDDIAPLLGALVGALPSGRRAATARALGCSGGHLTNIVKGRRGLGAPYREALPKAFGLGERAGRYAVLLATARWDSSEEARARARQDAEALRARVAALRTGVSKLRGREAMVRRAEAQLRVWRGAARWPLDAKQQRHAAWPRLTEPEWRAAAGPASAAGAARTVQIPPHAPEGAARQDLEAALALSRAALYDLEIADSRMRFLVVAAPEEAARAVWEEEVARFQAELCAWAAEVAGEGGPWRAAAVQLQLSPLSRAIRPTGTGSASKARDRGLRPLGYSNSIKNVQAPSSIIERPPPGSQQPDAFTFDDIAEYFAAYARWRRRSTRGRRYSASAIYGRVVSPSHWSNVVNGNGANPRQFSLARARQLIGRIRVDPDRAAYLELLASYSKSADPVERGQLLAQMMRIPGYRQARRVAAAAWHSLSTLTHLSIYELARHPDFVPEPAWIQGVLELEVSVEAVAEALQDLMLAGALREEADGRWRPAPEPLRVTGEGKRDLYHQLSLDMLKRHKIAAADSPQRCRAAMLWLRIPAARWGDLLGAIRSFDLRLPGLIQSLNDGKSACTVLQHTWQLLPAGVLP